MFVSRLLVLLSPPFSVFATRKEMEKNNATPRRKGESPKEEEERGQSKVGGPSSHFCVVLFFSPLSFRVVLLGVVMLSHRSLVWRFFPFLGGAVFSFWVVLLSLPVAPFGVLLSFFLLVLLPPSTRAGVLLSPPPGAAFLSWVALPFLSFFGWCCFLSLFALLGGALLFSLWVVLLCSFWWCCLPLPHSGGADFPVSPGYHQARFSWPEHPSPTTDRQHTFVLHLRERASHVNWKISS